MKSAVACLLLLACCALACSAIAADSPVFDPTPDAMSTDPVAMPDEAVETEADSHAVVIHLPAFPKLRAAAAAGKAKLRSIFHCPKKCTPAPVPAPQPKSVAEPTCQRCERLPAVTQYAARGEVANIVTPCALREPVVTPCGNWRLFHRGSTEDRGPAFSRRPAPESKPARREFPASPIIVASALFATLGVAVSIALVWRK